MSESLDKLQKQANQKSLFGAFLVTCGASRKESVDQIYSANSRRVLPYPDDPAAPSEALVRERSLELLYFRLTSPEKTAHD
jgi:hypothetical protein